MAEITFKKREIGFDIFAFFTNLALIGLGFFIVFATNSSLQLLILLLLAAAIINGITLLIKALFYPIAHRLFVLLGGFAYVGIGASMIAYPQLSIGLLALVLGFWFFIDAFIKIIITNQYRLAGEANWWAMGCSAMASLLFAGLFVFSSRFSAQLFLVIVGGGLVFQGTSNILDNLFKGQSLTKTQQRVKGGYFFLRAETLKAALFPRQLMNRYRSSEKEQANFEKYLEKQKISKAIPHSTVQIEVFIHSWENDPFMMGHTDFAIGDMVLSYGTYDGKSLKLGGLISEGVLAVTTREKYLAYATKEENKVLLGYTINLTDAQIAKIQPALIELFANTYDWFPPAVSDPNASDAASQLYRITGATFYKFKSRQFKYYFALNSNCVRMTEKFLNQLGIKDPHIGGVISPGDYMEFLDREVTSNEDTEIIARNIYARNVQRD